MKTQNGITLWWNKVMPQSDVTKWGHNAYKKVTQKDDTKWWFTLMKQSDDTKAKKQIDHTTRWHNVMAQSSETTCRNKVMTYVDKTT